MFPQVIFSPLACLYLLGLPYVLILIIIGAFVALIVEVEAKEGVFGSREWACASVSSACVSLYFALLLYVTCWRKIEIYYSTFPWLKHNGKTSKNNESGKLYPTRCPFTGARPTVHCPSCGVHTSEAGFNRCSKLMKVGSGRVILRWDIARRITEKCAEDPIKGRKDLDAILDFRGNFLTGSLSDCCIGCATWQRCFNLQPRLTISLALAAFVFSYLPLALPQLFEIMGEAGIVAQGVSVGFGLFYALAALVLQVQAVLRASSFASKYQPMIPEMQPLIAMPQTRFMKLAYNIFSAAPWDPVP